MASSSPGSAGEIITVAGAADFTITGTMPATRVTDAETLRINGDGGGDSIDASALAAGAHRLRRHRIDRGE